MKRRLDKKDFRPFLQNLIETYDLFAPVQLTEGVSAYKKIDQPEEVDLSHSNSQKAAKEVFFPQSEVMLQCEKTEKLNRVTSVEEVRRERILLGARPCDLQAISILDPVFMGKEYTDVYYLKKRETTLIIGFACDQPRSTCFCSSVGGGPFIRTGSDLFFIDLGDAYLIEFITKKGGALRDNRLLKEADAKDLSLAHGIEKKAREKLNSYLPVEGIEKSLDRIMEGPFWDRIHEKCIGCGVCTFLCPTCHCFDIADEAVNNKGRRVRNWDSCLFPLYSLETSGHNPRPTGRERTRQRLMHKFNYYPKNFGRIACVGCGRCIAYCPVNFDIREAIEEIKKG